MRHRLYIDEVGNSDLGATKTPTHRYLSLTGLVFELDYVRDFVFPKVEDLKREYFDHHPDTPIILHRKELVNKKFPFHSLKEPGVEKSFNDRLLFSITHFDYTTLTVVIDKWEHMQRYREWRYDPYHYCLSVLLERFVRWLERQDAVGDVMAESRGKKEDQRLKEEFSDIWWNGHGLYVGQDRLQTRLTSRQLKVKPKAANVAGLQVADLLAHPSYKAVLCRREHKSFPNNFGGRIAHILEASKYDRSPSGRIDGWGRKWLP